MAVARVSSSWKLVLLFRIMVDCVVVRMRFLWLLLPLSRICQVWPLMFLVPVGGAFWVVLAIHVSFAFAVCVRAMCWLFGAMNPASQVGTFSVVLFFHLL